MKIGSVRHKGLRRFIEADDASGLPPAAIRKIRNILSFLQEAEDVAELRAFPAWKAHQLTGDRKGTWALHVTANWRLTFEVDGRDVEIVGLDFEDYH